MAIDVSGAESSARPCSSLRAPLSVSLGLLESDKPVSTPWRRPTAAWEGASWIRFSFASTGKSSWSSL